ncbi:MAG: DUF420 domain-containing protein [Magnetococcus sp. XQGC-1]
MLRIFPHFTRIPLHSSIINTQATAMSTILPHWNTVLNIMAITLAWVGVRTIRSNPEDPNVAGHKRVMIIALITVIVFLASYLIYHAQQGITPFPGQGAARTFYYTILIAHALFALLTGLLLPVTLFHALRQQRETHKTWAKRTLIAWTLASLTGLIVYLMVYHWQPTWTAKYHGQQNILNRLT